LSSGPLRVAKAVLKKTAGERPWKGTGPSTSLRASFQPCRQKCKIEIPRRYGATAGKPDAFVAVASQGREIEVSHGMTAWLKPMPFHEDMIRVILPFHLRTLAHVGSEVTLEVVILKPSPATQRSVLDECTTRH
jgi:hypothetical protein